MPMLPNPFDPSASDAAEGQAVASLTQPLAQDAAADLSEHRFVLDEDKFMFDIGCVPGDFDKYIAMMEALVDHDEPPLFLRQAV